MPSVSQAQHRYFEGVASGDIPANAATRKAARDYVAADHGRRIRDLPEHADPHHDAIQARLRSHRAQHAARVRHHKGHP